jgi:hypothetical protein
VEEREHRHRSRGRRGERPTQPPEADEPAEDDDRPLRRRDGERLRGDAGVVFPADVGVDVFVPEVCDVQRDRDAGDQDACEERRQRQRQQGAECPGGDRREHERRLHLGCERAERRERAGVAH